MLLYFLFPKSQLNSVAPETHDSVNTVFKMYFCYSILVRALLIVFIKTYCLEKEQGRYYYIMYLLPFYTY